MTVRRAALRDARELAELHCERIADGFLPSLGPAFLTRLYRRIVRAPGSFAVVEEDEDGTLLGFAAGSAALGRLYKQFLFRDGLVACAVAAPRLLRSARRVLETLRYPTAAGDLPEAEILAVAVAEGAGGRGVGRALVEAALGELRATGIERAKVVTGATNEAALTLYRRCGFTDHATIQVHDGTASTVLVWTAR